MMNSNPLEDGDRSLDPVVLNCFECINHCSSEHILEHKNVDDVSSSVSAISNAFITINAFADLLEEQWAIYGSEISHNKVAVAIQREQADKGQMDVEQEDTEDHESLDHMEMVRSSIYQFLQKLSRYYTACHNVTSKLITLICLGAKSDITVETILILTTTSTPANKNKLRAFLSYMCTQV